MSGVKPAPRLKWTDVLVPGVTRIHCGTFAKVEGLVTWDLSPKGCHRNSGINCANLAVVVAQAMLSKVPGKDVTVHIIAARVRMDMKVSENTPRRTGGVVEENAR